MFIYTALDSNEIYNLAWHKGRKQCKVDKYDLTTKNSKQNLFFVAFSLEKLKGFVHYTNKHVCKYNAKNIFCVFATYGTGNKHIYTIFRQQNVN